MENSRPESCAAIAYHPDSSAHTAREGSAGEQQSRWSAYHAPIRCGSLLCPHAHSIASPNRSNSRYTELRLRHASEAMSATLLPEHRSSRSCQLTPGRFWR